MLRSRALQLSKKRRVLGIIGISLIVAVIAPLGALVVFTSNWLSAHSLGLNEDAQSPYVILVVLDSRNPNEGGLPDAITIVDTSDFSTQSVPRDLTQSRNSDESLVMQYLGISNCEPFCSLQGIYAYGQLGLDLDRESAREIGLLALRDVVVEQYGLDSASLIALDMTWAYSFLNRVGSIQLTIDEPIPVKGMALDGEYVNVKRYLLPGNSLLSGEDLFWFARARFGSSNENRMERQGLLLESVLTQKSRLQLIQAALEAKGFISTDISFSKLFSILQRLPAPLTQ